MQELSKSIPEFLLSCPQDPRKLLLASMGRCKIDVYLFLIFPTASAGGFMIVLNFANMMRRVIGVNGLDEKVLDDLKGRVREEHKEIADRKWKELEFMDLPDRDTSEIK